MDLSIVILHHGNPRAVTDSLTALSKAILPSKTEVFVVNNGKPGSNAKIPFETNLKFSLRFFELKNSGYPAGNNYALNLASGKYLCILTDVIVKKNTFRVLLDYLEKNPKVGIVAPRLIYPNGGIQDNFRAFPKISDQIIKRTFLKHFFKRHMHRYLMWDKDPEVSEAVDWLTGAIQIFTRKCWKQIGPKDERYFLFMSDIDICRTAWKAGFAVHFVGETEAIHNESRLSGGGIKDFFRKPAVRIHVFDALKYFWKYRFKQLPKNSPSAK